jgi:hypothetical protein
MKRELLLIVLALAACSDPTDVEGDGDRLMRTSALTYSLANRGEMVGVDIPFTFDNRTGADVYLTSCTGDVPPFLERKDGQKWRTAWTPPDYGCSSSGPVRISPGQVRADTLHVFAYAFGGEREPQFNDLNVAGTYRLRWDQALSSYDFTKVPPGEPIALGLRVSNEFQLEGEYTAAPPDGPRLTYLEVTVSRSPIAVGDSANAVVTGRDQFHRPIAVTDSIVWWTTTPGLPWGEIPGGVAIRPSGTVIGLSPGKVLINGRVGLAIGQTIMQVVAK